MLWLFGHEAYGILAPWLGIEPKFPTLEDEVFKKNFFFLIYLAVLSVSCGVQA